jgi:hypothetical protein
MKVYILNGTNVDGTQCIGVFKSVESLNKTLESFDDPKIYSKNPYDEYDIVEKNLE